MPVDQRSPKALRAIGLTSLALVSLLAVSPTAAEIKTINATGERRAYAKSSNDPISLGP